MEIGEKKRRYKMFGMEKKETEIKKRKKKQLLLYAMKKWSGLRRGKFVSPTFKI